MDQLMLIIMALGHIGMLHQHLDTTEGRIVHIMLYTKIFINYDSTTVVHVYTSCDYIRVWGEALPFLQASSASGYIPRKK